MSGTMWLVSGTAGCYSSTTWWPVAVFDTKEQAEDFARRAGEENAAWAKWRCPNADTTCTGRLVNQWHPPGWWRRHKCQCGGQIPCHLDTRCDDCNRGDASYEIDEVRVP